MSETFGINVEVNPGATIPKIKSVGDALERTEQHAKETQRAMTSLGSAFTGAAQAMAAAAEQEARMFQMATGRSKDFGFQLQALQKLHTDGRISGEQYINTLHKMGVEMEMTTKHAINLQKAQAQQAAATIGTGAAPKAKGFDFNGAASMVGKGMGAAAVAGGVIASIDHAVESYHHLEDRVTGLTNKAQKFTNEFKNANDVIREQVALGQELHTTAGNVMGIYDSVGDATERLNLTTSEQTKLTELLGKGAMLGGKSLDSVGDRMMALSTAFETGGATGKQIRSLFNDFNEIGNDVTKTMGLTREQIIELADKGKLSYKDFVSALLKGGGDIRESFTKIKITHGQQIDQFTEGYELAMTAGKGWAGSMSAAIDQVENKLKSSGQTVGEWGDFWTQRLRQIVVEADLAKKANEKFAQQLRDDMVGSLQDARKASIDLHVASMNLWNDMAGDLRGAIDGATGSIKKQTSATTELTAAELMLLDAQRRRWDAAEAQRAREVSFEKNGVTGGVISASPIDLNAGMKGGPDRGDGVRGQGPGAELSDYAMDTSVTTSAASDANKQMALDAEAAAQRTREAWASASGQVVGSLLKMAAGSEVSTEQIIGDLAKIAIQLAATSIGGPAGGFIASLGSSLLGGAHGFDYVANSNAMQLPGFAHGGSMLATGGGGVDQQLAMFKVSSGESIHVRTPQQREAERMAAMGGSAAAPGVTRVTNQIVVSSHPGEVARAMSSRSGMTEHVKLNRKLNQRR